MLVPQRRAGVDPELRPTIVVSGEDGTAGIIRQVRIGKRIVIAMHDDGKCLQIRLHSNAVDPLGVEFPQCIQAGVQNTPGNIARYVAFGPIKVLDELHALPVDPLATAWARRASIEGMAISFRTASLVLARLANI